MAEHQVHIEFSLDDVQPDADVLERFAEELEERAGEMAPVAAIHGDRFSATLSVKAESPLEAGRRGAEVIVRSLEAALETEIDVSHAPTMRRLLVEDAVPA